MPPLYFPYRQWKPTISTAKEGVIVGADLSQQWILPWWWHHYNQFNSYPVAFVDFGMSEESKKWCQERGKLLPLSVADIYVTDKKEIDASLAQEWEETYGKEFWIQRNGWFKKPLACLLSPYQTTIWIDLDCEVRSSLQDLFSYANHPSGIALAKDLANEQKGYNSGVIVFKYGAALIEKWADQTFKSNHIFAGDQDILTKIIFNEKWIISELPLIYNWSRCKGENSNAKIFHWHGRHGKTVIASQFLKMSFVLF